MLENNIKENSLFLEMQEIASSFSLEVVEVRKDLKSSTDIHISVTLGKKDGEVSIEDCENFHRSILPSMEIKYGREVVSMEVSSAGIQRTFKDFHEFEVFNGRYCRIYSSKYSSWIEGTIFQCSNEQISIADYIVIDTNETGKLITLGFNEIQKAKLEYKWQTSEDKKRINAEKQKAERNNKKKIDSGEIK